MFSSPASSALRRTALHDLHVANGGKMVDFAGWALPVQYSDFGIIDSCLHTRSRASLFDVSHMGQLQVFGKDRIAFVESLTVGDIDGLKENESRLSVFTTESGGILDDTVITKKRDFVQLVLNAACVEKDLQHIERHKAAFDGEVELLFLPKQSLIALQGPESATVLGDFIDQVDLGRVAFMTTVDCVVAGVAGCSISRSGYTGEDGFEISIPTDDGAVHIAERLLSNASVKLAGLAARDTLRIEAGLCLYGSDINESISPIEAGLAWTVSKRRRVETPNFPGSDVILNQLKNGVSRKRVGITVLDGPPARSSNPIYALSNPSTTVGVTTSGTFSPSLGKSVAIGYVELPHATVGTDLLVEVRGKTNPVVVSKLPFIKPNYFRIQ